MHWNRHIKLQAGFLSHLWHNKKQQSAHLEWCGFWEAQEAILGCRNDTIIHDWSDGNIVWRQTKRGNFQQCILIYVKMEITFYFSSYFSCCFEWKWHFVLNISSPQQLQQLSKTYKTKTFKAPHTTQTQTNSQLPLSYRSVSSCLTCSSEKLHWTHFDVLPAP